MKNYFVNPVPFIVQSVFMTFIFGVLGFGSLSTGAAEKSLAGMACLLILAMFYWWAVFQVKTPAVRIEGNSVTVRGIYGRTRKIDDVKSCHLVVSNTWVGLRRAGHQDVIIDSGRFSRVTWHNLLEQLRKLPMGGMDAPLSAQPPARWVAPTLIFFGLLFLLAGVDELVTGDADTASLGSVSPHIVQASTEPGRRFTVAIGNLLISSVILLIARQQWRLRRAALNEAKRKTADTR